MKTFIFSLVTICSLHCAMAQQESIEALMGAGTSLHDRGDYTGAIAEYDKVIGLDNHYYMAYEEKSLSLIQSGQAQVCVAFCKQVLKRFKGQEIKAGFYINYATALVATKQSKNAIKMYEKGIRQYPGVYLLYFNKGVTEYNMGRMDDAGADFKQSLMIMPTHAGSHMYLAYSVGDHSREAAVMAMATFLMLEPEGERAGKGLQYLNQLLGIRGYNELTEKLQSLTMEGEQETKEFFVRRYCPFFTKLKEKNFMETAAHVMLVSAGDKANQQWLIDNESKVEWLYDWLKGYEWGK